MWDRGNVTVMMRQQIRKTVARLTPEEMRAGLRDGLKFLRTDQGTPRVSSHPLDGFYAGKWDGLFLKPTVRVSPVRAPKISLLPPRCSVSSFSPLILNAARGVFAWRPDVDVACIGLGGKCMQLIDGEFRQIW